MRVGPFIIARRYTYSGGGTHLPDINIIAPVFAGGQIVAYVANIAHHADVGGMVSGSESTLCTSIFQEGIRLPMVRICRAGTIEDAIVDIIRLNSRTPDERLGDLHAQIAACRVGVERVDRLFSRHGRATVASCIAYFLEATGKRFTAAVERLPDGVYESEEWLDPNGADAEARLHVRLSVAGGRLNRLCPKRAPTHRQ